VSAARGPGVEVDGAEIRRPRDLGDLGDAELVRVAARRERDARRLDPVRTLLGHALLVDRLALDPAGEAPQLRRPLVQRTHDPLLDGKVVADEVELGVPAAGEVDLVRIGYADDARPDLELDRLGGHAAKVHRVSLATSARPLHRGVIRHMRKALIAFAA